MDSKRELNALSGPHNPRTCTRSRSSRLRSRDPVPGCRLSGLHIGQIEGQQYPGAVVAGLPEELLNHLHTTVNDVCLLSGILVVELGIVTIWSAIESPCWPLVVPTRNEYLPLCALVVVRIGKFCPV